jgi:hypothetical protein
MHQDETAAGHRPGQRPARGGPDDRVLVSVQHQDRLGDAGDAAGRQFRGEARGELTGPGIPVRSVAAQ